MSAAAPAATPAAQHHQPPRAVSVVRPRGGGRVLPRRPQARSGQIVHIPERVYRGSHYSDGFIKAWVKMAALDVDGNAEHCNAHVREMARFCGLSVREFERALTQGREPGPDGGPAEFSTRRMTRSSGVGRTAIREVRPVREAERYVTVAVAMADALEPRLLRAALLLAHAAKYNPGYQPTADELAGELFHHHGASAGQPLSGRTARRILHALDETGWVSVGHRAGRQGRHTVTVHRRPVRVEQLALELEETAPADTAPAVDTETSAPQPGCESADTHGGSGPVTSGGSLAIKEYNGVLNDRSSQVEGGSRRSRTTGSKAVDNSGDLGSGTFGPGASRAPRGTSNTPSTTPSSTYTGPGLQLSPRIWRVLAPVRHELTEIRPFVLRRIARSLGEQLDGGATEERLAERIERRYAPLERSAIGDMGRWLLGVGIVHRTGCGNPHCESGTWWPAGTECEFCALNRQVERAQRKRTRELQERLDELQRQRQKRPAKASYRERAQATDAEVLAVAREYGPAHAVFVYGHLRAAALLREHGLDTPAPASAPRPARALEDRRPAPAAPTTPAVPAAEVGDRADTVRATIGLPTGWNLTATCPSCHAEPGQPCTTPRGRRRTTPHQARSDAATAASGEETRTHAQ